jgi:hypothetical protein
MAARGSLRPRIATKPLLDDIADWLADRVETPGANRRVNIEDAFDPIDVAT